MHCIFFSFVVPVKTIEFLRQNDSRVLKERSNVETKGIIKIAQKIEGGN